MRASCGEGLHSSVWADLAEAGKAPRPGAHVRARGCLLHGRADGGRALLPDYHDQRRRAGAAAASPRSPRSGCRSILPFKYDPSFAPAAQKSAVTLGMGMTEKQGGTDVRAATTKAEPVGERGSGAEYIVTGHKWFMSAPMSDAFLVLAQARGRAHLLPDAALPARRQRERVCISSA